MAEKKLTVRQKIKNFLKQNIYAVVVATSVVILAVALAVTAVVGARMREPNIGEENLGNIDTQPNIEQPPMEDAQASSTAPITFVYPVKDYTLGNTYTDTSLVYNETLNEYTTHLGIDFIVGENADVMASLDGVVESVNYDSLTGTIVMIDHGDGLKTSYSSLASEVNVTAGQKVSAGEVIGKASSSASSEQNIGAHLHFETIKDGVSVNPMNYLGEK